MTRRIYISDTNIWIDFHNAGLLDALFSLPFKLCCTDFVLEELHNFDTGHLLHMGLMVETFDEAGTGRLFGLMSAHNNSSLAAHVRGGVQAQVRVVQGIQDTGGRKAWREGRRRALIRGTRCGPFICRG